MSAGRRFKKALSADSPLHLPGTLHAYAALVAERSGSRSLFVGGGVANASYGLPDLGMTSSMTYCPMYIG